MPSTDYGNYPKEQGSRCGPAGQVVSPTITPSRVLIVDDEPGILEMSREFLEDDGRIVIATAGSADAAISLLKAHLFDVIISDYQMPPGMNSIELLKKLRVEGNETPFIIFTGRGREEVAIEALNNGAAFYLQKGINIEVQFTELRNMIFQLTRQKRAEAALKESEEQNRMIVENAPDVIYTATYRGSDRVLTSINPAFELLTGWSCRTVTGNSLSDYIHTEDKKLLSGFSHALSPGDLPLHGELRIRKADGGYILGAFITVPVVEDGRHTGELGIVRDITNERRNTQLLREKGEELEEKNKELESFCYSVSHDLRAPLRIIEGFSDLLLNQSRGNLSDESQHAVRRIKVSSKKMDKIIEDLLRLSRAGRSELLIDTVNITQMAQAILRNLASEQPGRRVKISVAEGLVARCDRALLQGALENVLDNAWKYTGKNEEAIIEVGSLRKDGRTAFYVKDNGAGFDSGNAKNLFMPFSRYHTESEFPGNGVGLSIVRRVVQRHGGDLFVESTPGKGAMFYFTLPEQSKGPP